MKLLVSFLKFIQSLCLLLIPILIFYCILSSIQVAIIDQYKDVLGTLLSPVSMAVTFFDQTLGPLVNLFKGLANFEIDYNSTKLEFTHFIAAAGLFCLYHVIGVATGLIKFSEKKTKEFKKIKSQRKAEALIEQKMLDNVSKYKVYRSTVLILRLKKTDSNTNYLVNYNDSSLKTVDPFEYISPLISLYSGIRHSDIEKNGDYYIVFKNIMNAVNFDFELKEKIKELNDSYAKVGSKISYFLFAENFLDKANRVNDFTEIDKLFYLTGENEIFVGETFKKYYECFSTDTNCRFISKGLYSLDGKKEVEIYSLLKKK